MSTEQPQSSHRTPDDPLWRAVEAKHSALLLTGNLHDFSLAEEGLLYRPQMLADLLHARGYLVVRYAKSQGGRIHCYARLDPKEKQAIDSRLNAIGLLPLVNRDGGQQSPDEVRSFFRAAARLVQLPTVGARPVALLVDYTEHLAPAVTTSAAAADEQTFVAETLHALANAPALRKSGNLLICLVRDGFQNSLLNDLYRVDYPFPGEPQMRAFIDWILARPDVGEGGSGTTLAADLPVGDLARLTRGLRLRDVEAMLREAKADKVPLNRHRVLEAKAKAILRASEGTLAVMSTPLTLDDIVGLEAVKRFFGLVAAKLKAGDPASPRAILMAGPPGTSKSTFAPLLAAMCGFNCVKFQNVKNMWVGESERRLTLALSLVEALAPSLLFLDEITETTPSRNQGGTDAGVSQDLLAQLFQFSARDDLRGKVLLLAASNVPERLDPAWHDRFVIVPFLELLPHEMCALFPIYERRLTGASTLQPTDEALVEASRLLHQKGASPRRVLDIVNHALLTAANGRLDPATILKAAKDYVGAANPLAVAYTSLVAVSLTNFNSFLPWSSDPKHYIYPWYLEGMVDPETGELDHKALHARIRAYQKEANL